MGPLVQSYAYRGEQPPPQFNMARYCLAAAARRTPDKPALLVIDDPDAAQPAETWTYANLEDAVLRLSSALVSAGLKRGQRLMIRLDNTSDYALLFFAAIAAGIVPLPASSQLSAAEAAFLLQDSGARALALGDDLGVEHIPPGVEVFTARDIAAFRRSAERASYAQTCANDPAFLIYTSGTTAKPKGVLHAQRSAWGRRPMYQGWYGISAADRVLHAGAFNWTYTLGAGLTDPWANGATALVYTGEKDPAVWPRLNARHGVTIFAAVPSLYRQILKYCDAGTLSMPSLRHGLTAGETLPAETAREWRGRTGTQLYEALGMSELSTYISSSPAFPPKPGAAGRAQPGRCVVILPPDGPAEPLPPGEMGLIAIHRSDPGLMLGYWRRPAEEQEVYRGDWFTGGDTGVMDEEGYIAHQGRANELMNAMGYRVSPLEVEEALAAHPSVAEAAAAEIEVRPGVHVIGAFIVLKEGAPRDPAALAAFAETRLAKYKLPREYIFADTLPRTANGKVRRAELKAGYALLKQSSGC